MKLKKATAVQPTESEAAAPVAPMGSAVIADRFKLDADVPAAKPKTGVSAIIALVAALLATALLGATAALMYTNWGVIVNA